MMYSTCTFTPEEDEQVIAWFLREHTDMVMQPIEPYDPGFRPGRPAWADGNPKLKNAFVSGRMSWRAKDIFLP